MTWGSPLPSRTRQRVSAECRERAAAIRQSRESKIIEYCRRSPTYGRPPPFRAKSMNLPIEPARSEREARAMSHERSLELTVDIVGRITVIRGLRVLLDSDLAALYGVTAKRLNEQVRRNTDRFPSDFAFRLTEQEVSSLRSHFATLDAGRGKHRKYRPWAFTEHGAIMAASILSSPLCGLARSTLSRSSYGRSGARKAALFERSSRAAESAQRFVGSSAGFT